MGENLKLKTTKEEALQIIIESNLKPIDFYSEYVNAHSKITCIRDGKYKVLAVVSGLKRNSMPRIFDASNPYSIENIKIWLSENNKNIVLDEEVYMGNTHKMKYHCLKCGCSDVITWASLYTGYGCSVCSGQKVCEGYNDIATTRPDLVKYFIDKEDSKMFTKYSNIRKSFICPNCGYIKRDIIISNLAQKGFSCALCSDTVSIPEKFMANILYQSDIEFITQYSPKWSNRKRYDFYFVLNNKQIIIETHGMQHYAKNNFSMKVDNKVQEEIDSTKFKNAINNGINNYYIIDCSKSDFDFLKHNIIEKLGMLIRWDNINWDLVWENCQNSTLKEVCSKWCERHENDTTQTLADYFKIDVATIRLMLHRGTSLGYCTYDSKKEKQKVSSRAGELGISVKMYSLDNKYIKTFKSLTSASREIGVSTGKIKKCCDNIISNAGGYIWEY